MAKIASAAELEEFSRLPDNQKKVTAAIKSVLAETALTGVIRYSWSLMRPVVVYLMDQVLRDYEAETSLEVGPPRPLPNEETLSQMIDRFKGYLLEFRDAPWTLQRICELLLEPHKQYTKLHKVALAIEKLLLVTSEARASGQVPEPPVLDSLGPVNENPPKVAAPVPGSAAGSRKRRWEGDEVGADVGGLIITALNSTANPSWPADADVAAAAAAAAAHEQPSSSPPAASGGHPAHPAQQDERSPKQARTHQAADVSGSPAAANQPATEAPSPGPAPEQAAAAGATAAAEAHATPAAAHAAGSEAAAAAGGAGAGGGAGVAAGCKGAVANEVQAAVQQEQQQQHMQQQQQQQQHDLDEIKVTSNASKPQEGSEATTG